MPLTLRKLQGDNLRMAVYTCNWETHWEQKSRKMILMLLLRTSRPVAIRTMFRNVCLDALTEVCIKIFVVNTYYAPNIRVENYSLNAVCVPPKLNSSLFANLTCAYVILGTPSKLTSHEFPVHSIWICVLKLRFKLIR